MNKEILNKRTNGDFEVTLYSDGTKIRVGEKEGVPEYPESMDVKITNQCDAGCPWCHEKSKPDGKHADLGHLSHLLENLPAGTELALGGGNPLSHPELLWFLDTMKSKGIICNLTVNEKHFTRFNQKLLEGYVKDKFLYGVGYSYHNTPCTWDYEHLVTHIIIGNTHPRDLEKIVSPSKKVLLLGYKNFGLGEQYKEKHLAKITTNISAWFRYLPFLIPDFHISMDNLAIEQLRPQRLFLNSADYDKFYMGDDGKFTMYLDAVEKTYGVSSIDLNRRYWNKNIKNMFLNVRMK